MLIRYAQIEKYISWQESFIVPHSQAKQFVLFFLHCWYDKGVQHLPILYTITFVNFSLFCKSNETCHRCLVFQCVKSKKNGRFVNVYLITPKDLISRVDVSVQYYALGLKLCWWNIYSCVHDHQAIRGLQQSLSFFFLSKQSSRHEHIYRRKLSRDEISMKMLDVFVPT